MLPLPRSRTAISWWLTARVPSLHPPRRSPDSINRVPRGRRSVPSLKQLVDALAEPPHRQHFLGRGGVVGRDLPQCGHHFRTERKGTFFLGKPKGMSIAADENAVLFGRLAEVDFIALKEAGSRIR